MNSQQRLKNVLGGQPVDRVPNFDIFMTYAAHHIHEPLSRYYLNHHVLCEANLAMYQDLDLDIVQAISDPYREAVDAGLVVEFPEDGLPISKEPLIKEPEDLEQIRFPIKEFGARMTDRLEAIYSLREQVGDSVPVMGWVEGALAEICDLRGMNQVMKDLLRQPAWLKDALEKCEEMEIAFAIAQIKAGATIIGLGDAVASQISPRMYREYALPYERRIFDAVHANGATTRLHICGNTTHLLSDMAKSGADIIDIDWMVDLHQAANALDGIAVCGNLDPVSVFLLGTPEDVRRGVFSNAQAGGARWISAAGCEVPDGTPIENLNSQRQALIDLAES